MEKFTVGQEVVMTAERSTPENGVVRKVGRQYVYASPHIFYDKRWWRKFDMETGYEQVNFGSGGSIYSVGGWEEETLRREHRDTLKKLGVERSYSSLSAFALATSSQLQAIIDILTNPTERTPDDE